MHAHHDHVCLIFTGLSDDNLMGDAEKHLGSAIGIALGNFRGDAGQLFRYLVSVLFNQQRGYLVMDRLDYIYDHDLGLVRQGEIDGAVDRAEGYRRKIGRQQDSFDQFEYLPKGMILTNGSSGTQS